MERIELIENLVQFIEQCRSIFSCLLPLVFQSVYHDWKHRPWATRTTPQAESFSIAWLLAFRKSFAWLVSRVVGLFTPVFLKAKRERNLYSQGNTYWWYLLRVLQELSKFFCYKKRIALDLMHFNETDSTIIMWWVTRRFDDILPSLSKCLQESTWLGNMYL